MKTEQFKAEVLPLRDKLFLTARRLLENQQDAEDAVQEVFIKLLLVSDNLDRYDSVAAYATTMVRNHCIDKLRVRNREGSLDEELYLRAGPDDPCKEMERKSSDELIRHIISQLPPLQQAIIRMRDIEEYELSEISEMTGTQPEAVRVNLSRARKKVREEYIRMTTDRRI